MKKAPLIVVVCFVTVALCGFRIGHVNNAYPEQHTFKYTTGEQAIYGGQNSSGEDVAPGSVSVEALSSQLINYQEIKEIVPSYIDSMIDDGTSSDMRALIVDIEIINTSSSTKTAHIRDYKAQSGAWANGLYAPLYMALNDDPSTMIKLEPGQKVSRSLVYLMYDVNFHNRNTWEGIDRRGFQLILALYPDKYLIDLDSHQEGVRKVDAS